MNSHNERGQIRRGRLTAALVLGLLVAAGTPRVASSQVTDLSQIPIPELTLQNESLQSALVAIIQGTGMSHIVPVIAAEADSTRIGSLLLRNITVADALDIILEPQGYTWVQDGDIINIVPFREERVIYFKYLASRFAAVGTAMGAQGATGGAQLGGAAAPGGAVTGGQAGQVGGAMGGQQLETQLEDFLSPTGLLKVDVLSHTIYVEDLVPNVERLAWYVELIDQPPRQVEIEVVLAEIVHREEDGTALDYQLGVTGGDQVESALLDMPGISQTGFLVDITGLTGLGGIFGGDLTLDAALRALATISKANVISKPSAVVLDGRPATMNLADQIPYTEAVFGQGFTGVSTRFKDVGIILTVTPTILDSFSVQLNINAQFSTATTTTAEGVPVVESRTAISQLAVGDQEVMIIGGLIREQETETYTGVPFLSKIPIIKHLFSSRQFRKEKRELVIFVSPKILNPEPTLELPPGDTL